MAIAAVVVSACGGTNVTQLAGPDPVRCDIAFAAASANVPASATQLSVAVTAARDCTWTAQTSASWVQVTPTSGQGDVALTVNVAANSGQSARSGEVVVGTARYQVVQAGASPAPPAPPAPPNCSYTLVPTSRTIGDQGGTRDVRLITGSSCPWEASSTVSWISIIGRTSGTGSIELNYRVERNRSDDSRTGRVLLGGRVHTVRQEGD